MTSAALRRGSRGAVWSWRRRGSFTGSVNPGEPRTWMELPFLSFTCLSSVCLSDVMPISSPARVLVMLEQFAGVGYIATVVSRLIGLTIARERG